MLLKPSSVMGPFTLTGVQSMLGGGRTNTAGGASSNTSANTATNSGAMDKDMVAMKKALASPKSSSSRLHDTSRITKSCGSLSSRKANRGAWQNSAKQQTMPALNTASTNKNSSKRQSKNASAAADTAASHVPHLGDLDSSDEEDEVQKKLAHQSIEEKTFDMIAQATRSPAGVAGTNHRKASTTGGNRMFGAGKRFGSPGDRMPLVAAAPLGDDSSPAAAAAAAAAAAEDNTTTNNNTDNYISKRLARGFARQHSVSDLEYESTQVQPGGRRGSHGDIHDSDSDSDGEDDEGYVRKNAPRRYSSGGKLDATLERHQAVATAAGTGSSRGNRSLNSAPAGGGTNVNDSLNSSNHSPSSSSRGGAVTGRRRMIMAGRRGPGGALQRSSSVNNLALRQQQQLSNSLHGDGALPERASSFGDHRDSDEEEEDPLILRQKRCGRRRGSVERRHHPNDSHGDDNDAGHLNQSFSQRADRRRRSVERPKHAQPSEEDDSEHHHLHQSFQQRTNNRRRRSVERPQTHQEPQASDDRGRRRRGSVERPQKKDSQVSDDLGRRRCGSVERPQKNDSQVSNDIGENRRRRGSVERGNNSHEAEEHGENRRRRGSVERRNNIDTSSSNHPSAEQLYPHSPKHPQQQFPKNRRRSNEREPSLRGKRRSIDHNLGGGDPSNMEREPSLRQRDRVGHSHDDQTSSRSPPRGHGMRRHHSGGSVNSHPEREHSVRGQRRGGAGYGNGNGDSHERESSVRGERNAAKCDGYERDSSVHGNGSAGRRQSGGHGRAGSQEWKDAPEHSAKSRKQKRISSARINDEDASVGSASGRSLGTHSSGGGSGGGLSQSSHGTKVDRKTLRRSNSLELPESAKGKLDQKLARQTSGGGKKKSLHDLTGSGGSGNSLGSGDSDRSGKLDRMLNNPHPNKRPSLHDSLRSGTSADSGDSGGSTRSGPAGLGKSPRRQSFQRKKKVPNYDAVLNAYVRNPQGGESDSDDSGEKDCIGRDNNNDNDVNEKPGGSYLGRAHLRQELAAQARDSSLTRGSSSRLLKRSKSTSVTVDSTLDGESDPKGKGSVVQRALGRRDMVRSYSLRALDDPGVEDRLISSSVTLAPPEQTDNAKNKVRYFNVGRQRHGGGNKIVRSFSMKNRMGSLLLSDHSRKTDDGEDDYTSDDHDEIISFGSDEHEDSSGSHGDSDEESDEEDGGSETGDAPAMGGSGRIDNWDDDDNDFEKTNYLDPSSLPIHVSPFSRKKKKAELPSSMAPRSMGTSNPHQESKNATPRRASLLGGFIDQEDDHDMDTSVVSGSVGESSLGSALSDDSGQVKKAKASAKKKKSKNEPVKEEDKFDWEGKAREDKQKRRISRKNKKESDVDYDSAFSSLDEKEVGLGEKTNESARRKQLRRSMSSDGVDMGKGGRRTSVESNPPKAEKTGASHLSSGDKMKNARRRKSTDKPEKGAELKRNMSTDGIPSAVKVKPSKSVRRTKSLGGKRAHSTTPHRLIDNSQKDESLLLRRRSSSMKRTSSIESTKDESSKVISRSSSTKRRSCANNLVSDEPSKRDRSKPRRKRSSDSIDTGSPQLDELLLLFKGTPQGVRAQLEQEPSLAEIKDRNGCLALHFATQHDAPVEVIEKLIETYPEACDTQCDKTGFTPLHYALEADIATSKIKALLKACPRSLKMKDRKGQVPLHVAAGCNTSFSSIRLLVFIYPESVDLETAKGETPRKIAKRKKANADVLSALKTSKKSGKS